jgi:RNA polymerase sigma-70 factor (ECF subfamily)
MSDGFDTHAPRLRALAYRMLGVRADAEDAVQETALRWLRLPDRAGIDNPQAWLTRVCTRICIDALRARRGERAAYVGPWLAEPYEEPAADVPALAESLRLAFLLMLERLSPAERAALLLREAFDADYDEVAEALDTSEAMARQHVSRAKRRVAEDRARFPVAPRAEAELMGRFAEAVASGDASRVAALLHPEARFVSDGGGKVLAALNVVEGADRVARLVIGVNRKWPAEATWAPAMLNGALTALGTVAGEPFATMTLATDGERITALFLLRNPDKLAVLTRH